MLLNLGEPGDFDITPWTETSLILGDGPLSQHITALREVCATAGFNVR
ncbi:MAG TPA: hypothetical protein VET30_11210 [Pseudoxanthomonas sp.]|nr:hypothetical protein [Pseudoxanthomonas sp.]